MANKIALGQIDSGIAGGVDTTSDAPIGVHEELRHILLAANRGKTTGDKVKSLLKIRPRHLAPSIPRNGEPRTGLSMGESCELMAQPPRRAGSTGGAQPSETGRFLRRRLA